ncbi:MAG: restriction endonuclease subunit S [Candidatus Saccharibacteria bacterium]
MIQATQKIPAGYKQTDIGVIPADWDVKRIIDFTDSTAGGTPSTLINEYWGGDIKWMSSGELNDKKIIDVEGRITEQGLKNSSTKIIPKYCVLIGLAGQGKTRGTVAINYVELCTNQSIAAIYPSRNHDSEYLYFNLDNRYLELRSLSTGGEGRGGLNLSIIKKIQIAFPRKLEQTAIATVLADTDALIENLEKLIAKKKAIKQGAMQQLLTGKKRLPGFSGEWEVKKLGEMLDYEQPTKYLVKEAEYSDGYRTPVLTAGKTFILGYTSEEKGVFDNLPVIIFDDFTTAKKFVNFPFKAKSSAMKMLKPRNKNINLRFLFEKMQLIDFKLGDHKRYWISEYQNIELETPKSEEQTAITTVLSDMDTEIEKLENKLNKYRQIKTGMMQQLLTGKIRLLTK